ncbi:hypothetical protein LTR17_005090 [Elasticomyces elasticus]|nr:hypothetical protein LTR17_005090 [Elasticomyces elasticus]
MASFDDHRSEAHPTASDALSLSRLSLNDDNTSLNAAEEKQQPPIFRIAAELRNQIYELASPAPGVILVRAEILSRPAIIRFHPKPPPLYYTCSRMRHEYPLYDYYATNTFLFTDNMMEKPILWTFARLRGELVHNISSLKVNITHLLPSMVLFTGMRFSVRFSIKMLKTGKIVFEDFISKDSEKSNDSLCFCELAWLAEEATSNGCGVFRTLQAFVEVHTSDRKLGKDDCDVLTCQKCGMKTIVPCELPVVPEPLQPMGCSYVLADHGRGAPWLENSSGAPTREEKRMEESRLRWQTLADVGGQE